MFSWNQLHRGVKAIFFLQVVNRLGDFVVPFLTLILTQVQGLSPALAGLVVTAAGAVASLGSLVAGRLGDKLGRRDVLLVFLGISGTLFFAVGFAPSHPASLVALVAAQFFLGAMRPVLGAILADLSDSATRRAAFSLSYLGVNLGASVGPLLAGWLFQHALNWLFWLDALTTAAALAILVNFVPRRTNPAPVAADSRTQPKSSVAAFVRHPVVLPLSLLMFGYNLVYAQLLFTLALQLVDLFGPAHGPGLYGLVWGLNGLIVIALTPLVFRFTRTWTNLAAMAWGQAFLLAGVAVFLFRPTEPWVIASTLLWTACEVLVSVHYGDLVSTHSPPELRARFQAYVGVVGGLGFVVAPLVSGLIAQSLGLTGVWFLSTFLVAFVGIGMVVLDRRVGR